MGRVTVLTEYGRFNSYRLGDWFVDPACNTLSKQGKSCRIEPLAMDVLVYLIARSPMVVSSRTLVAALWPNKIAGPRVVSKRINQIRNALGDDAKNPAIIETIPKRGYRLITTVSDSACDPGARQPLLSGATPPMAAAGADIDSAHLHGDSAAGNDFARIRIFRGQADVAKNRLQKMLDDFPDDNCVPLWHESLAWACFALGNYEQAADSAQRVIEAQVSPACKSFALLVQAACYSQRAERLAAKTAWESANRQWPGTLDLERDVQPLFVGSRNDFESRFFGALRPLRKQVDN